MNLSELCKLVIFYGSEKWCLHENEIAILKRTEGAVTKATCEIKLIVKNVAKNL